MDKTLLAVAHVAEQSLFSETYARGRGLLQALDVRIKLLCFLCILVMVSVLRSPQSLWVMYGVSLLLAVMSRVPLGFFLKRVWMFVPLFSAAIVLPALFNVVTPGDPVLVIMKLARSYSWGPYTIPAEIAVTRQGLWGAIVFVSRVAASVSFAVLFTLTTRWNIVFSGLRALFVPRIFVMTLSMTERYIFVFLRLIQDMYRARKSRTIRSHSTAEERNWTASRIGVTFNKSIDMSEDIYKAMLSRGFHGEFRTLERFHISLADMLWLASVLLAGVTLILFEKGLLHS
ncbi:MAG TPA: cobalt ECF transporter T component CbiQ [Nitrospirota bacterium]|nr:cobalt ECF transporter T component CbiQ [Nitrospirota bacterium]